MLHLHKFIYPLNRLNQPGTPHARKAVLTIDDVVMDRDVETVGGVNDIAGHGAMMLCLVRAVGR